MISKKRKCANSSRHAGQAFLTQKKGCNITIPRAAKAVVKYSLELFAVDAKNSQTTDVLLSQNS